MPEKESQSEKKFPDWNNLYSSQNVETMPWYNENLDSDLEEEFERRKVSKGRILDLDTGPATQAIQLPLSIEQGKFMFMIRIRKSALQ
jgi:hypothetical protein